MSGRVGLGIAFVGERGIFPRTQPKHILFEHSYYVLRDLPPTKTDDYSVATL